MNIRDLEAFVAVVETGSIVAASLRLNLTQPGVTRRVQGLEEALGTALLDRQSKPLKPTSAGRAAYEHGRRALRVLEDLRADVSPGQEVAGEFRLGVTPHLSEASLTDPIDRLRSRFPRLRLRVVSGWSQELMTQTLRCELDAAAVCLPEGAEPGEELAAERIGLQPVLVIAARDSAVPAVASMRELSRHSWVLNQDGCGYRVAIRRLFEAEYLPFDVAVEALNPNLRLSLVARGLGIGLTTPDQLAKSPHRAALRVVEAPDLRPVVHAWLVHRPPAGRLAAPIAIFREALAPLLAEVA